MTELPRLRREGNRLERELLSSAVGDAPETVARQRTLAALGLGAAVATAAATAHGAALGGALGAGAQGAAAPLATGSKLGALGIVKWLGGGLVAGAITAGTVGEVAQRQASEPAVVVAPAAPQRAPLTPTPQRRARPTEAAEVAESVPIQATPPSASFAAAPDGERRAAVAGEVELLDVARAALAAGKPGQALGALGSYQKKFPEGVLAPEAELVRMQVFAKLGDRKTVAARARSFLSAHPSSPHAPQVRTLLDQSEPVAPAVSSTPGRNVARFPSGG